MKRTRFPLPALALERKAQTRKSKRQEEPRVTATVVRTLLVFRSRLRVLCVCLALFFNLRLRCFCVGLLGKQGDKGSAHVGNM